MSQKIISFAGKLDVDKKLYKQTISNPSYWNKRVRNTFDFVYAPHHPEIESAYNKVGIKSFKLEGGDTAKKPVEAVDKVVDASLDNHPSEDVKAPVDANEESEGAEEGDVQFEDQGEKHWSELSWHKMRSLATRFTSEPVKNKDQAESILKEAEEQGKVKLSTIV